MHELIQKKSPSLKKTKNTGDFKSIHNEAEALSKLNEKLDLFINAAVNEANEINTRKIMYSHFKIKKIDETKNMINKISKINNKNNKNNKNKDKRNRTIIYHATNAIPKNKTDAMVKDRVLGAHGITIKNSSNFLNKSLSRLGVANDVSILLHHNEERSEMDLFDTYLHEKTHESKKLNTKDYWYDGLIISQRPEVALQALFKLSNGIVKDLSPIAGSDKPQKKPFTRINTYTNASRKNADTLKSAIKTLAYSTTNPEIIKLAKKNDLNVPLDYDMSDDEKYDLYYNLAQKIIAPSNTPDITSDEALFNYILREFGLIMLNDILRKHGNDAPVRLKDGELKFGKGRNPLKNILFGNRYKKEREAAAMYFLGEKEGEGKEISVAEAISLYDRKNLNRI